MNIGLDAKWFYSGHPSGKVFTQELVRSFARDFPQHRFVFFLKASDRGSAFPYYADNVKLEYASLGSNLLSNVVRLPFAVRKHKLDALIVQNFTVPAVTAKQATIVFDVIFASHPEYFTLRERMYFSLIKPLLKFSTGVITISNFSKQELGRFGFLEGNRRCFVLHLGVDPRYSFAGAARVEGFRELASKHGIPFRFVLYVGRLNERKNIPNLIRAMRYIEDESIPLVLAGPRDWKMSSLERLITEGGLEDRVILLGHVDRELLPCLYRAASVFAYVSEAEGFGLPPLEAMASGVPVVASNKTSLPEVCGKAALLVDGSKPEEIGEALNSVLTRPELAARLVQDGIRKAAAYTWERTASELLDYVSLLLSEDPG